jgi:DNA-binding NarL/FixJ family response regulator
MNSIAPVDPISKLTPRQVEIMCLLVQGKKYREIAELLSIGVDAVKDHVHEARYKLEVENRIQLIVMFTRWQVAQEIKENENVY